MALRGKTQIFPLRYGGGLLLCCIGAAICVGVRQDIGNLMTWLGVGAASGALCVVLARRAVAEKFGRPSRQQAALMFLAIAIEAGVFYALGASGLLHGLSDHAIWVVVLTVVAAHFLLMRWSFGPWIFGLGLAGLAWIAVAVTAALPLATLLYGDGILKIVFGVCMAAPLYFGRSSASVQEPGPSWEKSASPRGFTDP